MILANYHTHTTRCNHAMGTEREYIETAISEGFKILGFSDHTPQPYPAGYWSGIRMDMSELYDYTDTLVKLRDEYRDEIKILIGYEVEYTRKYFEPLLRELEKYPLDYIIQGQHYIEDEIDGFYAANARIVLRPGFDIHCDIVDKPLLQQRAKAVGMQTVRIEFDRIAERLDASEQVAKILPQRRFAARKRDAVEQAFAFIQKRQQLLLVHNRLRSPVDQFRIVTERTIQIASAEKHCTRNASRIIEQRHLLQTVNFHTTSVFIRPQQEYAGSEGSRL